MLTCLIRSVVKPHDEIFFVVHYQFNIFHASNHVLQGAGVDISSPCSAELFSCRFWKLDALSSALGFSLIADNQPLTRRTLFVLTGIRRKRESNVPLAAYSIAISLECKCFCVGSEHFSAIASSSCLPSKIPSDLVSVSLTPYPLGREKK